MQFLRNQLVLLVTLSVISRGTFWRVCFGVSDSLVFRNAWFGRFARKGKISAAALWEAVERAERGLIDADLGGGVIKQRISRPGAGI